MKTILTSKKSISIMEESEFRFHELIYSSPIAMGILKGKDLKIIIGNEPMLKIWGKGNEIIGKKYFDALPELKAQGQKKIFEQVYKTGVSFNANEKPVTIIQNGAMTLKYYNFTLYAQRNKNNVINGIGIIANDVTAQALANIKIVESENRYYEMFMNSPFAFSIMKGKDMKIILANELIKEFWGKGNNVEGKTLLEVLPELINQPFPAMIDSVYTSGKPVYANEMLAQLNRNGTMEDRYFNIVYEPLLESNKTISGVITIAHEVTQQVLARKKIEETEHKYQNLIYTSPYMIAIFKGRNLIIEIANDAILETWGKGKDVIGKSFYDVLPEAVEQGFDKLILNVFETGEPYHAYETPITLRRNERWELMHYNFIYQAQRNEQGEIEGVAILANEVTPQVIAKNELILAKKYAEIKTGIAENAMQAKQQFLSNMSHEIRTPMNAIVGFTNLILKTELNDSQKQYLDAIKVSGDALVVLINDILDLAKVDSGKMIFEKTAFDLVDCIHKIVLLFEIKLKEKKLKFNLNLDDTIPNQIIGDPMRLRQVILNLLSNAVKFTDKGSVSLDVKVLSHTKNKITIAFKISDTGIGIANEKLEVIFNNFEQAHAETSSNYGGTGLGLAIVKKLVENQGGTIDTESEFGKGTTFSFILEFETNNKQDYLPKSTTENDMICQSGIELKSIKILVAEDVLLNQMLIKIVLGNFNFEVDIAENGKIAIEKLQNNIYDLLLMDLHMPEMNGFEATRYIREEMKSQIPIIALTADVTQADIDKCLAIGMHDYISKPIDEALLYKKIVKVLNDSQK